MATIKHYKVVAALPSTLVADSIYLVRVGTGFDLYVTNSSGTIVAYPANYQAGSANLSALSGLTGGANKAPYFTGVGAMSVYDLTELGRSLAGAADEAAARLALGLGTAATRNTGTSGANVPLLSTGNTWSASQTVNSGGSGYVAFQLLRADQGVVGATDTGVIDLQTGTGALRLLHTSSLGQRWIAIPRGGAAPQYNDGAALRTMWHSGNLDNTESGWLTPTLVNSYEQGTDPVRYRRIGKFGVVTGSLRRSTPPGALQTIATLPAGYRPTKPHTIAVFWISDNLALQATNVAIGTDGAITTGLIYTLVGTPSGAGGTSFTLIFPVD